MAGVWIVSNWSEGVVFILDVAEFVLWSPDFIGIGQLRWMKIYCWLGGNCVTIDRLVTVDLLSW
jgi:hypothetical protein